MKVLFLDFDGVLNPFKNYQPDCVFSKSAVANLNKLLERAPDLKIVVSSSWRHKGLQFVKDILAKNGVDSNKVIDITEVSKHSGDRGYHIKNWLDLHKEVEKFVILDDESNMPELLNKMVKTNSWVGITEEDVNKALAILNKAD